MLCDELEGWERGEMEVQKRENIGIHMTDSFHHTTETNKSL